MSNPAPGEPRDRDKHLRDLVALSTLPSIWLGAEPMRVAESLAAALFTTVGPALVYVGLKASEHDVFAAAHVGRNEPSPSVAQELGSAILEWARDHDPDDLMPVAGSLGHGDLHLAVRPLAFRAEYGAIAAGFAGGQSPDASQHLLLNVAATQATTAVRNMQLLRSLRQNIIDRERSEGRERQANEELEALHDVSRNLAGELDLEKLVQVFTDAATRLSGAAYGAFFHNVQDGDGESYSLYALSGAPRQAFENFGLPRNSALFEPTFRGTGVVRLDDVHGDPRYGKSPPHYGTPKGHLPVRSYLAVPVVSRTREVLGGLFLAHPEPGAFSDRSERLAVGIAAYAAVAIDNARLYREAQQEIAERERAVDIQRLLIGELNHRVKNTLATVQAIAQQTLRHAGNPQDFVHSFSGRIQALSRVHTVLTQSNWRGTNLEALVREQLLLDMLDERRVTVSGPEVELQPQMTLHLAMVLHELATNSQKYGALSVASGSIVLDWTARPGTLLLRWVETGGPAPSRPMNRGFGTRLIEQSMKGQGGAARMSLEDDGITWEITLPLPQDVTASDLRLRGAGTAAGEAGQEIGGAAVTSGVSLVGRRILVVEDEPLVGLELVESLNAAGMKAIGPAATIGEALELIRSRSFDCALLDANLDGRPVHDIAAALARRHVPFAFVTGYSRENLPETFRHCPTITKPWTLLRLTETMRQLLSRREPDCDHTAPSELGCELE